LFSGAWRTGENEGRKRQPAALGRKRRGEARVFLGFDWGWLKGGGGLAWGAR
jgi:hypothetical protein